MRKIDLMIFPILILLLPFALHAGDKITIPRCTTAPVLDGTLDDAAWKGAAVFTSFKTLKPDFGVPASEKTTAYITFDKEYVYAAFYCFDSEPGKIKTSITSRDNMYGDDWIAFCLDTFNDEQNAYGFLCNPQGIQGDGMLDANGDLDGNMDMVWYSKGRVVEDGYIVEMKIPFKSIRFPNQKTITMGLWLFRSINRKSEEVTYPEMFPDKGSALMQWQKITLSGVRYQRIVEVLPALTHSRKDAHDSGEMGAESRETDFSLTAKLGITSQMVLDATYNPDYSQVEADAGQVDVNLRYALFYAEKRPFFLEGAEHFKFAGNTEEAPLWRIVHTRNIVSPQFGFKFTGKLGRRSTMAALYARDESPGDMAGDNGELLYPGKKADFLIFRYQHALGNDNFIGGFYSGREFMDGHNRVAGVDGRIRLSGTWKVEYHGFGSFSRDGETLEDTSGHALALRLNHESRHWNIDAGVQDISEHFRVDTGFITRTDITRLGFFSMYIIYPKSKFLQRIEPFYWSFHIYDKESKLMESFNIFTLRFRMPRDTQFRLDMILANEIFGGLRFNRGGIGCRFESRLTNQFSVELYYRYSQGIFYDPGNPYQGKGSQGSLELEYQPTEKLNSSLEVSYNDFYRDSDSQKVYDYLILRSRTTFQLNKYLFFRGIVEYNTYRKELLTDFLASFTYIPGTVIHVGYGSVYEKTRWDPTGAEYISSNRFLETRRGLFLKISYNWRL